jgi:hypothetical protein
MDRSPFISLCDEEGPRSIVSVPPEHEGFIRHSTGRLHLVPGVHRVAFDRVFAVFLVRVGGLHELQLRALGGAVLRGPDGRRRPIKVLGRLVYGVVRAEQFVDFLEREQLHDPAEFERELGRLAVELLANVFDGDPLSAEGLAAQLDGVSGELLRRLTAVVLPLGLGLHGLDLVASPAPLEATLVSSSPH